LEGQHSAAIIALSIGRELSVAMKNTMTAQEDQQKLLQPLLLSPHALPCVASTLVLQACCFNQGGNLQAACYSQQPEGAAAAAATAAPAVQLTVAATPGSQDNSSTVLLLRLLLPMLAAGGAQLRGVTPSAPASCSFLKHWVYLHSWQQW
jgi:hypothetical protein